MYILKEKKAGMVILVSKRHTQKTRLKELLHLMKDLIYQEDIKPLN